MTVKVSLGEIDGYDVSVEIHDEAMDRKLDQLEDGYRRLINDKGSAFLANELRGYVSINATPTEEKWKELSVFDDG